MGLSAVCDSDISRSYSLFLGVIHANSDGSDESAQLNLFCALVTEPKPRLLAKCLFYTMYEDIGGRLWQSK